MDLRERSSGPILAETIRLPDATRHPIYGPYLKPGVYGADGGWIDDLILPPSRYQSYVQARVVIEFAGVNVIWGRFSRPLSSGEVGACLFTNVPGNAPVTTMFGEWDMENARPRLSAAVFNLLSAQRGEQSVRVVGRNTFDGALPAAAGFILSPQANYSRS